VRDFTHAGNMSPEQWKHLALIAHHCYGSFDLAVRCVDMLIERGVLTDKARDDYMESLANC
jgi:hypothetical protein